MASSRWKEASPEAPWHLLAGWCERSAALYESYSRLELSDSVLVEITAADAATQPRSLGMPRARGAFHRCARSRMSTAIPARLGPSHPSHEVRKRSSHGAGPCSQR